VRGLRSIRTLSGKVDHKSAPYRAYMQITCLEMEKARRESERQSAARRISELDSRLWEIETDKTEILKALSEPGHAEVRAGRTIAPGGAGSRRRVQFKVHY
jgi:hypothetical protein